MGKSPYMTGPEVQKRLGISRATLWRWRTKGKLYAHSSPKGWLYERDEIQKLSTSRRRRYGQLTASAAQAQPPTTAEGVVVPHGVWKQLEVMLGNGQSLTPEQLSEAVQELVTAHTLLGHMFSAPE